MMDPSATGNSDYEAVYGPHEPNSSDHGKSSIPASKVRTDVCIDPQTGHLITFHNTLARANPSIRGFSQPLFTGLSLLIERSASTMTFRKTPRAAQTFGSRPVFLAKI